MNGRWDSDRDSDRDRLEGRPRSWYRDQRTAAPQSQSCQAKSARHGPSPPAACAAYSPSREDGRLGLASRRPARIRVARLPSWQRPGPRRPPETQSPGRTTGRPGCCRGHRPSQKLPERRCCRPNLKGRGRRRGPGPHRPSCCPSPSPTQSRIRDRGLHLEVQCPDDPANHH